ncbi:uncharacterized protein TRUGW13939_04798 [Talaromyces rugulosus]|uniref:HAD-like protein n=1 Tax=Talaromyces rugulosus TaxID=121627 RepID=A0A7H8QUJ9_TALRU|nr:uncharacterized protein TRUGW13939_04798 [Talaromyces rugulosus]QKX57680.1 hypothetical protein TRUGW13939_04798 [Talaromyces rugulosus]
MAIQKFESTYTAVLLELFNVVVKTSLDELTAVPRLAYQSLICYSSTLQYQRNEISYDEYKRHLEAEWNLPPRVIDTMFAQVRGTMTVNTDLLEQLRRLKTTTGGRLQIYAVSNASEKDYAHIRSLPVDWTIFDHIFTSAEMGMRKPELRCFRHVLQSTSKSPHEIIFIDPEPENVLTAQSLGMKGIKSTSAAEIEQILHNLILDPLSRARSFLQQHAKQLHSVCENGTIMKENFAQLLILEATGDKTLIELEHKDKSSTWNFFIGTPIFTKSNFPDDLDTTSMATTVLGIEEKEAHQLLDRMLQYVNQDGLILTFFTDRKNRIDPVVCVNVLTLFYTYGRGHELAPTLEWIRQVVIKRAYMHGTPFYPNPEQFLFFLGRLLRHVPHLGGIFEELRQLLRERLKERLGLPADPIALVMRLISCNEMGIRDVRGMNRLLAMQCVDGGWEPGAMYTYASKNISIGNRGVSTVFAIQAIEGYRKRF